MNDIVPTIAGSAAAGLGTGIAGLALGVINAGGNILGNGCKRV